MDQEWKCTKVDHLKVLFHSKIGHGKRREIEERKIEERKKNWRERKKNWREKKELKREMRERGRDWREKKTNLVRQVLEKDCFRKA